MNGPTGYRTCAKCKVKRQIYITDEDPTTLTKYKTCDACRRKNKQYKRRRKLRLQHRRNASEEPDSTGRRLNPDRTNVVNYPSPNPPTAVATTIEDFLYPLSMNSTNDAVALKLSITIPEHIIPRLNNESQKMDGGYIMSTAENYARIRAYREDVKRKLKLHYSSRIFDVLNDCGYSFKTRSTNWKNSKFYSQMLCSEDSDARKKSSSRFLVNSHMVGNDQQQQSDSVPSPSPQQEVQSTNSGGESPLMTRIKPHSLRACHSHLNYSFDSGTGRFQVDFTHLCHKNIPPLDSLPLVDINYSVPNLGRQPSSAATIETEFPMTKDWLEDFDDVAPRQIATSNTWTSLTGTLGSDDSDHSEHANYLEAITSSTSTLNTPDDHERPLTRLASALNSLHQHISSR